MQVTSTPLPALVATFRKRWRAELLWNPTCGEGGCPYLIRMQLHGAPASAAVNRKLEDEAKTALLQNLARMKGSAAANREGALCRMVVGVLDEVRDLASRALMSDVHQVLLEVDAGLR